MGPWVEVETWGATAAVAEVAGCGQQQVGIPINRPRPEAERFMPFDDTGRQWEVEVEDPDYAEYLARRKAYKLTSLPHSHWAPLWGPRRRSQL